MKNETNENPALSKMAVSGSYNIKIVFPQIVFETKIISVSKEKYEDLMLHHIDREDFLWDNLTENEQNWTNGKKWVESSMDAGYSGLRVVSE